MSLDFKILSEENAWDFSLSSSDIEIDLDGDFETISGWEKCAQDVIVAVMTLYNEDDPIAPLKGTLLPVMLGGKLHPVYTIPIMEDQIKNALEAMYSEQLEADLDMDEIIDIGSIEVYSNYHLFQPITDKRILYIYLIARTLKGSKISVQYPFSSSGVTEEAVEA